MRSISRLVEPVLRTFDNGQRELVLRWRIWKMKWFPYRTARFLGFDDEGEMMLGPWKWHLPDKITKRWFP